MPHLFDFALEPREDSPSQANDLGGFMSQERRRDPQPLDRFVPSNGDGSLDTLSAQELDALRQRLAGGFYESEDVLQVIADAVMKELESASRRPEDPARTHVTSPT